MTMLRYNAGKAPLSLIPSTFFEAIFNSAYECGTTAPTKLIWQVGAVLDFGAQKYSAHNWRKGGTWSSVLNSAFRHLIAMASGSRVDFESNQPEAGHLGCNIAFLLEFVHTSTGVDDRYSVMWAPTLNADAHPNLTLVLDALLRFRDGGNVNCLREAAWELARWVEIQEEPAPAAAAPPPPVDYVPLPFKFPSFPHIPVADLASATRH
ncbi:dATP/dGTP diphosphohydrolase domain-containing protein [Rhizobium sp. Leaf383]|uniref:dATP/dGTP diphosphohydrolase domain-containing protein n=1 Tax=Rhizobium sp. Leaf383 TaxID=1736357 RepID=UPI000712A91C|nr:dATP/dGTP diphosphohydrolase domain-containing protein [Rhizobium sp. Leaf383]KQS84336.1 hypothetical protein ASG58_21435 [Rhizobium sp. Leaf383]